MALRRFTTPLLALALLGLFASRVVLAEDEGAPSLNAQTWEESKADGKAHVVKFYAYAPLAPPVQSGSQCRDSRRPLLPPLHAFA